MGKAAVIVLPVGMSCLELGVGLAELKTFALCELDWQAITGVACGLEPGWDQAMALTAIDVQVPVHLVIPYLEWPKKWSSSQQKLCDKIIEAATTFSYWTDRTHDDTAANKHLGSLADQVILLAGPRWKGPRQSVITLKDKPVIDVWPGFVAAGVEA